MSLLSKESGPVVVTLAGFVFLVVLPNVVSLLLGGGVSASGTITGIVLSLILGALVWLVGVAGD